MWDLTDGVAVFCVLGYITLTIIAIAQHVVNYSDRGDLYGTFGIQSAFGVLAAVIIVGRMIYLKTPFALLLIGSSIWLVAILVITVANFCSISDRYDIDRKKAVGFNVAFIFMACFVSVIHFYYIINPVSFCF